MAQGRAGEARLPGLAGGRYEFDLVPDQLVSQLNHGNAQYAAISPDGKYVAYSKSEGGKESLWLRQVKTAGNLEISPALLSVLEA